MTSSAEILSPVSEPHTHADMGAALVASEVEVSPLNRWEQRSLELQQLVDPGGTLPSVNLVVDQESSQAQLLAKRGVLKKFAYDQDGNRVGEVWTTSNKFSDEITEIAYIQTNRQGEGYGTAMYLQEIMLAVSQGKILTNDSTGVSSDAKRIWENFAEKGVAVVRKPFVLDKSRIEETYQGRYAVLPYS